MREAGAPRGFTLIELLVVIAIIGVLSSVVLGSLSIARTKARDTRRIEDIKQIQTALSLYYDTCRKYPTDIYAQYTASCAGGLAPSTAGFPDPFMPTVPKDPVGGLQYTYYGIDSNGSPASCDTYHIGVVLEEFTNNGFTADADYDSTSVTNCTGGGSGFNGVDPIYDKVP